MRLRYFARLQLLPLKISVFVMRFSNTFWHRNETFPKVVLRMKLFLSLQSFTCHLQYRVVFHLCSYQNQNLFIRVALVSFVQHSCRTRVVRATFVLHLRSTRVAFVSFVSHSCGIRVTRIALVSLVSGTLVVNQTGSWSKS